MRNSNSLLFYALILASATLYYFMGYHLFRYEHQPLILSYAALFLLYLALCKWGRSMGQRPLFLAALALRLVLIISIPALSDDVWRFIWDGRLWVAGIHPFSYTPIELMNSGLSLPEGINWELYDLLNSKTHYTIYPPVAQYVFFLAGVIFPHSSLGSIVLIRSSILLLETGTLLLLPRLLQQLNLPRSNWILYAFNPLIILELTGNLHFEAGIIFFLLLTIYYMHSKKVLAAGISFALGIASKLIPLLFAPLFVRYLGWKKSLVFYLYTGSLLLLLFLPLWDQDFVVGMKDSLGLYFVKFEFNASIYFIVRAFGYLEKGYNIIGSAGPWLAWIVFMIVLLYTLRVNIRKTSIAHSMLWLLLIYLLLSTIVHPWYITPLIALCVLTGYRFPILWSGLIFLTYTGYTQDGYSESLWISVIEYLPVIILLLVEWSRSGYFLELYNKVRTLTR